MERRAGFVVVRDPRLFRSPMRERIWLFVAMLSGAGAELLAQWIAGVGPFR